MAVKFSFYTHFSFKKGNRITSYRHLKDVKRDMCKIEHMKPLVTPLHGETNSNSTTKVCVVRLQCGPAIIHLNDEYSFFIEKITVSMQIIAQFLSSLAQLLDAIAIE